jgi:hypothetical protein
MFLHLIRISVQVMKNTQADNLDLTVSEYALAYRFIVI